jgi:hypothetical protein
MGGIGSTRWYWHTPKTRVESCYRLSISYLTENHLILPNMPLEGTFSWGEKGPEIGFSINTKKRHDYHLRLIYEVVFSDSTRQKVHIYIPITETPQNWGGVRYWFSCPVCGRRINTLYLPHYATRFKCRKCHDLTYRSCQESHVYDRMFDIFYPGIPYRWAKRIWEQDIGRT